MQFLTEPPPPHAPLPAASGIFRLVARNPGPMTCHGTNTWLVEDPAGWVVIDPGPDDAAHVAATLRATGGRVARILATHHHADHIGALPALRRATGAPVSGFGAAAAPDQGLADGDTVAGMQALHTPGHADDHLCFARPDGIVFSADHVMAWSSSVVVDMAAYMASLRRLLARQDRLYLPGHGPALPAPRGFVQSLLDHRLAREAAVLAALSATPATPESLVPVIYGPLAVPLRAAAARSLLSHLLKLQAEGRAVARGDAFALPGG